MLRTLDRGTVLGKGEVLFECLRFVPVHQEPDQLVFLVGLQHDVRDGGRGAGHADLEEVEGPVELLEGRVDTAAVVVIQQQVDRIELTVLPAGQEFGNYVVKLLGN